MPTSAPTRTAAAASARRWLTSPVESGRAAGFGVYLHVPFCHHRCGYCDFATAAVGGSDPGATEELFSRYVHALGRDMAHQVAVGPGSPTPTGDDPASDAWREVTSVFVGGGTPTLLPAGLLAQLLRGVRHELDVATHAEVTVECNPETASEAMFATLVEAGVTRISLGAQSVTPHVLATLERGHGPDRPFEAVEQARAAGMANVSLDLIFGTPGETDAEWRETLDRVLAAGVDHVSAYALTVHDNTALGRAVATGSVPAPDDDHQRDRFELAREVLARGGYDHYEISNWAMGPARRSRHNQLYWRHGDYLAIGVGAHGHLDGRRWWTTRSTARYLAAIEDGRSPISGAEDLTDEERAAERLLLGLRLRDGLHPGDLPPIEPLALEEAIDAGLIETACGRVRCTEQGWFLLDEAVSRLL